jgi:hypothetical protein
MPSGRGTCVSVGALRGLVRPTFMMANHKFLRLVRTAVGGFLAALALALIPHHVASRDAHAVYQGDLERQEALARGVERWVARDLTRSDFTTGSSRFDGEWLFGTYMMAAMGFGQSALQHPEAPGLRARHAALMETCIDRLVTSRARAFDREAWGDDPLDGLDGERGHAAYLGYLNLALGLHVRLDPESRFRALHDAITAALLRRIERSPTHWLETYPGEVYPVDNSAVVGSIGLHASTRGEPPPAVVRAWSAHVRATALDPATGLLVQAVDPSTGVAKDRARGSGSALASYFLSFADPALSKDLWSAVHRELAATVLGFGVVREYPARVAGAGDIDSGPVVLGAGVSATGFALAASRIHRDEAAFIGYYATANLFGAPRNRGGTTSHVTGGPLGDAILFAMMTALPAQLAPPAQPGAS